LSSVGFGAFLPTFSGPDGRPGTDLAAFARRAEELGYDSLWATDHLLHGSLFYRQPWLDPVVSLSFAAAVTSHVRLGSSIIVMPTRNPVLLAKDLASLQSLSAERFILGAGTGWDANEFQAVGIRKSERGRRTDEALEIVRRLLGGERLSYEGKFHTLREVEVGPRMRAPLQVWIAGGRQLPDPNSPERPILAPAVIERIAKADGWIARPTATPSQIKRDREEILQYRDEHGHTAAFTVAHENFLHYVPTDDPAKAEREQRRAFIELMGDKRPFEYFQQVYLTGTREEILQKINQRLDAGIQYLMLHTLEPSTRQLELWAEELMPYIRSASRP
jgi:probable F420-dependent oxidoreductase